MDTTHVLFIAGGAFSGLDRVIQQRTAGSAGIGFHVELSSQEPASESVLYEVPSCPEISRCVVDEAVVAGDCPVRMIPAGKKASVSPNRAVGTG